MKGLSNMQQMLDCWKGREGFPGEKFPIFISENSDFLDCLIDGKNQKLKLIEVEELAMTY